MEVPQQVDEKPHLPKNINWSNNLWYQLRKNFLSTFFLDVVAAKTARKVIENTPKGFVLCIYPLQQNIQPCIINRGEFK